MNSKNALISVSDKTNLYSLVSFLFEKNYNLYSTGGTYSKIIEIVDELYNNNLESTCEVHKISDLTQFPEILNGRVKTLHPRIYGGILADHNNESHCEDMNKHNLLSFSLVVVNLYPFEKTVAQQSENVDACIENIDIGGVSLIRASSKNFKHITLLSNPNQYSEFIEKYDKLSRKDRLHYALVGFQTTTHYDACIKKYFDTIDVNDVNDAGNHLRTPLKYGLNPHQSPSFVEQKSKYGKAFDVLQGSLGYINVVDFIHGWLTVRELEDTLNYPASISMKHTSPAGVGVGNSILPSTLDIFGISEELRAHLTPCANAFIKARSGDPLSSFGDFIGISGKVDTITARLIKREICDGIVAADFDEEALEILRSKKGGKFIIVRMNMDYYYHMKTNGWTETKEIYGLQLTQPYNSYCFTIDELKEKYGKDADLELLENKRVDFTLAYSVLKYSQSNNISMVYNGQILGLGCGQQNRVGCVRLAGEKAKNWMYRQCPSVITYYKELPDTMKRQEKVNAVYKFIETHKFTDLENKMIETYDVSLGSDGFFPFPDNIEVANEYNVKYILQPGGSMADEKVQKACDTHGIHMFNVGHRMFYH